MSPGTVDVGLRMYGRKDEANGTEACKSWDVLVTLVLGPICDLYIQVSQT